MHEEVTEQSQEVSRHSDAVDRKRTLLRAVFGELPVPVFVLDDGGFIRRANGAAAQLLGTPTAYMAGKPFPVFVDLAARAALRSQPSAVLRGAGPVTFSSMVLAARRRLRSRLMLARVSLPSEVRPLVTVAVFPPAAQPAAPPGGSRRGLAPAAAEPATRRPPGSAPEEDALAAATRRVDMLSQVTRLLLDEQSLSEPVTLHRVAWLLQADAAEWVIIDLGPRRRDHPGRHGRPGPAAPAAGRGGAAGRRGEGRARAAAHPGTGQRQGRPAAGDRGRERAGPDDDRKPGAHRPGRRFGALCPDAGQRDDRGRPDHGAAPPSSARSACPTCGSSRRSASTWRWRCTTGGGTSGARTRPPPCGPACCRGARYRSPAWTGPPPTASAPKVPRSAATRPLTG